MEDVEKKVCNKIVDKFEKDFYKEKIYPAWFWSYYNELDKCDIYNKRGIQAGIISFATNDIERYHKEVLASNNNNKHAEYH